MKNYNNRLIGMIIIPFIALAVVTQLYLFLPVSQNLIKILDALSSNNMGLLTSSFGIFYAFGFIIWGTLSDKVGKETILIIGLLSLAMVTFIIPFVTNYGALLLVRSIQGFCAAAFPPVAISWIASNLSDAIKSKAISLLSCAFLLAGTIGQWFGYLLITDSLYGAMWPLALIYLFGAGIFYSINRGKNNRIINPKIVPAPISSPTLFSIFRQLPKILLSRNLFAFYLGALFLLLSFVALYFVLNSQFTHLNIARLRNTAIVAMLFSLTASYLFKFIAPLKLLIVGLMVMSATMLIQFIYLHNQMDAPVFFLVIHFLFILGLAYAIPAIITCVTLYSDEKTRGSAISLYTCILFIGASLGALLPDFIQYQFLISTIAVVLFLCAICLFVISPKKETEV